MIVDQAVVAHLICVSIKTGYELNLTHLSIIGIGWVLYIYFYGYYTTSLAFSPSYIISSSCHGTLHLLTSGLWVYGIYVKHVQESQAHLL
jgi:hypothetical protein